MEKNLMEWVERISKTQNDLGGFSICPYAKKALEEKKIFWSYISSFEPIEYILRYMEAISDYEVVIFYNLNKHLTNHELLYIITELQKQRPQDIFLKDHPFDPGYINGLYTGNGEYPLVLAQPRNKLIESREKLKKTKYYDFWSEEYKREIWSYGNES